MGFEPQVLESIEGYSKKTRRDQLLLMVPFILAFLFSVTVFLVTVFMKHQLSEVFKVPTSGEGSYWQTQVVVFVKVLAGALAVILVAGLGYNLYASARYARARFQLFVEQLVLDNDHIAENKYLNALEGAAIAAGVAAPGLRVLDDPAANALAFEDEDGNWEVGVTSGLLKAEVSVSEATAIMAHELAHLIIGEGIRMPGLADLEFQPSLMLVAFSALSAASILAAPANMLYAGIAILCILTVLVVLMLVYRSQAFIMKLLDLAHHHDDMLADSVAAKMTGDPSALKSAIEKVESLTRETGRVPGGTILARYMFVTPPGAPGDYVRFATEVATEILSGKKQPRTWLLFSEPVNRATRNVLDLELRLTRERLINLDLIEQGRWRALEDWSSD
jgi:Zn-dependent protease with chaperone function